MRRCIPVVFLFLLAALFLSGCGAGSESAPAKAVEEYLTALAAKDETRLTTLSCADWEDDAMLELDAFQAVELRLEDLACEQTGTDGATALVLCQGHLIATYDTEDQDHDLSVRTYQVVQEGGEWLVCGTR